MYWILFIAALITPLLWSQHSSAWVHGIVLDENESVIPGVPMRVISGAKICDTLSDETGRFKCEVAPGKIQITGGTVNMFRYQRATINIAPGERKIVQIRPVFKAAYDPEMLEPKHMNNVGEGVSIRFTERVKRANHIVFRGPHLMLTCDFTAIYAAEISCDETIRSCETKGKIRVEVGEEAFDATEVVIDIVARQLTLKRQPLIMRKF